MSPPDSELLTFLKDWILAPVIALLGFLWKTQKAEIKEVRCYVDEQDNALRREIDRQRDIGAKLFDKLDEHARRSEDRHVEILTAVHTGLAGKADK